LGYIATFARPFWRRPWITFLPAEVLERARKPCVFALFLLLGLYVKDIDEIYTKKPLLMQEGIPQYPQDIHRLIKIYKYTEVLKTSIISL
jgi:hypothetical protein